MAAPTKDEILEKVKRVCQDYTGVPATSMTPETRLAEDLGADSLDLVEMVMAFEDEYEIEIQDEDVKDIATLGAVVDYLAGKVAC